MRGARDDDGTPLVGGESVAHLDLARLGWTDERESAFAPFAEDGLMPGRVTSTGGLTTASTASGPVEVIIQRRFRRSVASQADLPVVGDWLALQPLEAQPGSAALRGVLPRTSHVSRADVSAARPGAHVDAQVVAANVDVCLLVSAFGGDLNPRRIERYLLNAWAGGTLPVVVVNKADLVGDPAVALAGVLEVAGDAPVHAVSARTGDGLEDVRAHLEHGVTACLLGSSGVGKSTLTNALLGEERQAVRDVRADDHRGRHTTSRRELFPLPGGALLVDTPGLRAVGLWDDGTGLERAFADVEALAASCRFRDCRHQREPGCAVRAAIDDGDLSEERLEDLRHLEREVRSLELRTDVPAGRAESRRRGRIYRDAARISRWKEWDHAD
jgi:ribosome biogenesis GTPase / thiamine phosphate phosphatase